MEVSIIVTTLNRKSFLKETIDSILNQTYQDFEIIVVDSYSDYNFIEFMNSYKTDKIKFFQNNKGNSNISINRNYGVSQANGKYLAFCDDDDVWEPNKLDVQMQRMRELQKSWNKILIHSETILFNGDFSNIKNRRKFNILNVEDFFKGNPITYSSVLVTNGPEIIFDEDPAKRASEDLDLWVNLFLNNYKFELINVPLVRYRISMNSAFRSDYSYSYLRYLYIILGFSIKYKLNFSNNLYFLFFSLKLLLKFFFRKLQGR